MDHQYSFEKLRVWQDARNFVTKIYKVSLSFPKEEHFCLTPQIRRAAISVPANIAEGSSRSSQKDRAHFTQIAYGSALEVLSHLYVALDLQYLPESEFQLLKNDIHSLTKQLSSLRNYQLKS